MTELDESIFDILKYGGGKIITNKDELKIQIPRYNTPEEYSKILKEKNELKNGVSKISVLLHCIVRINPEHEVDALPYVVKMRKHANGIVESENGFTYYILDKSKIDWELIDGIFDTLFKALEHRIISHETYNFIINRLYYRIYDNEFNVK